MKAESFITSDGWYLGGEPPIVNSYRERDWSGEPFFNDVNAWRQFTDDKVYQFDKTLRDWIAICLEDPEWRTHYSKRKYTVGTIWPCLFNRQYDVKIDGKVSMVASRILAYYSSKIQSTYYDPFKKTSKPKKAYTIMTKALEKPPYSLRLRMEWLAERGEIPTMKNMKPPKDDLKVGRARNERTDRNMRRRSRECKDRYNEYQRARKERIKQEEMAGGGVDGQAPHDDVPGHDDR